MENKRNKNLKAKTIVISAIVLFSITASISVPVVVAQDMTPNKVIGKVVWTVNSTEAVGISVNVTCNEITKTAVTKSAPPPMVGRFDTDNVPGWDTGDAFTITIPGYVIDSGTTSGTLIGDTTDVGTLSISEYQPPIVTVVYPNDGATDVPVTATISATFSKAMNTTSVEGAFSIVPTIAGTFSWTDGDTKMIFTPSADLAYNTTYTATISTTAKDLEENHLESDYIWSFTTEFDTIKPDISYVVVSPSVVNPGDLVHVTAVVTDNVAVAAVAATGGTEPLVYLIETSPDVFEGNITAVSVLDSHMVTVIANDTNVTPNIAYDTSQSYTVADLKEPIVPAAVAIPETITATGTDSTVFWVVATDLSGIKSVTMDLTAIGGLPEQPLTYYAPYGAWNYTFPGTTNAGTFYLPVTVTDNAVPSNSNTSVNITLTVISAEVEFPIELAEGLNLVSIPLIPETVNNLPVYNHTTGEIDTVAEPIIPCSPTNYNITTIWRYTPGVGFGSSLDYQGTFGDFDYWYSSDPTFNGIEPDRGYFFVVKSGGAFTWTVIGSTPVDERTVDLAEGLNLVGMTSVTENRGLLSVYNATTGEIDTVEEPIIPCSPTNYNVTTIWRYTPGTGFGSSLDYQGAYGDFDYWYSSDETFKGIEPGRGYFFVVKPDGAFPWEYLP